jgi:hypothetical protein
MSITKTVKLGIAAFALAGMVAGVSYTAGVIDSGGSDSVALTSATEQEAPTTAPEEVTTTTVTDTTVEPTTTVPTGGTGSVGAPAPAPSGNTAPGAVYTGPAAPEAPITPEAPSVAPEPIPEPTTTTTVFNSDGRWAGWMTPELLVKYYKCIEIGYMSVIPDGSNCVRYPDQPQLETPPW